MKISFIGSGDVSCTTAFATGLKLGSALTDIVLIDIREDWAKGNAIDLKQAFILNGNDVNIIGTTDYKYVEGSDVIVITAGKADKGGQSNREALLADNKAIIGSVAEQLKKYIPTDDKQPLVICVTNPLDLILNHLIKVGGFNKKKTIGSGNRLDTARFKDFISRETGVPATKIQAFALAQHGAKIVYAISKTLVDGKPLSSLVSAEKIEELKAKATAGSQEIIGLLQIKSTTWGPGVSIYNLIDAYLNDKKSQVCLSAWCEGEYGVQGYTLGVPAILGKDGVEKIVDIDLSAEEKQEYEASYKFVLSLDTI
ncbi:MAG: malate dehydrogenase [Rickettsiales bacterium]|nr:MAG: malate dehydrogenase [Rickettsiales bacterium]